MLSIIIYLLKKFMCIAVYSIELCSPCFIRLPLRLWVSVIEENVNIITADANDMASVNWALDGADAGSGNSVSINTPLGNPLNKCC